MKKSFFKLIPLISFLAFSWLVLNYPETDNMVILIFDAITFFIVARSLISYAKE